AKPTAILVGRLIAAALGGTYLAVAWLAPGWEVIPLLVIFFATPWLLTKGTAFNARNSSYRNVRFAFDGKLGDAYAAFVGWPILGMLSLGAVMPIALQRQARWHIGHHHFGDMPFRFHTPHGPYFGLFWKTIGLLTACSVAVMMVVFAGAVVASLAGVLEADGTAQSTEPSATMTAGFLLVLVATYIGMILTYIVGGAYLVVRSLQIGLGRSTIGDQPFTVDMRVGEVAMLYFTNTLAILFSLGLAVPWAKVRAARYQLEHTAVHLDEGSMQRVTAKGAGEESAIGEEVGEAFDIEFDFGL
ncbi:MAG: YjgN family protein, partial [Pseudomonadota bacterium]